MTKPTTMRAMEIKDGALALAHLPRPQAKPGELLIKVAYVGINRADILQRDGKYPAPEGASPLPGMEVSGTIVALGQGVTGWTVGDEVCALLAGGGYAEYVTVPAGQVLPKPAAASLQESACLPEAAATAIMALTLEAQLKAGERMLVHGGTSGVGLMMVQVAKLLGAEVFTTAGSDEKIAFLNQFGVHAINHRTQDFAEEIQKATNREGIDVIIDTLGASHVPAHLALLKRGGRMVSLAMMDGAVVERLKIGRLLTHHLRWSGTTLRSKSLTEKAAIIAEVRAILWPAVERGAIRPVIDSVFPLEEAEKAFARMQERLHLGKILLEVAANEA